MVLFFNIIVSSKRLVLVGSTKAKKKCVLILQVLEERSEFSSS